MSLLRSFALPSALIATAATGLALSTAGDKGAQPTESALLPSSSAQVHFRSVDLDGLQIAYREAGPTDAPTLLLLHGFPTSSHMFRNLMRDLGDEFHLVAPDYPGYGASSMPSVDEFDYSFDNLAAVVADFTDALGLDRYSLYLMDYGAPIGFRLATARPERVDGLVIQNGNAYVEGLEAFWDPLRDLWADRSPQTEEPLRAFLTLEGTRWQYTHGVRDVSTIAPDNWYHDQYLLDRPGNVEIQLALFESYGTNPPLYPEWQEWMREAQPPTLIVWGANDEIFPAAGAHPYKRDLENLEFHLLDTGHFALEEEGERIASEIRHFLRREVARQR
ncbi:MAG: alpha/beta hydrolase [Planctomycetota bacterium]